MFGCGESCGNIFMSDMQVRLICEVCDELQGKEPVKVLLEALYTWRRLVVINGQEGIAHILLRSRCGPQLKDTLGPAFGLGFVFAPALAFRFGFLHLFLFLLLVILFLPSALLLKQWHNTPPLGRGIVAGGLGYMGHVRWALSQGLGPRLRRTIHHQ